MGRWVETRGRFPFFLLVPFDAMEKEKKRSLERQRIGWSCNNKTIIIIIIKY